MIQLKICPSNSGFTWKYFQATPESFYGESIQSATPVDNEERKICNMSALYSIKDQQAGLECYNFTNLIAHLYNLREN